MLNYASCPNPDMAEVFQGYVEHGWKPGSFTTALLSNDLLTACTLADHINQHLIFELVEWCYNELPASCWQTPERVKAWIAKGGLQSPEELL